MMAIWSFVIGMESNQISKVNNDTARRGYMLVDAKESQKQNGMPQRHAINAMDGDGKKDSNKTD